ncbi:MAG: DUF6159 family protein [Chloroflexota bacterium]
MFSKISNSWELVKASASVLRADKELLIFPIISTIGLFLVTAVFAIPLFAGAAVDAALFENFQVVGFIVLFAFYIVQYTVIFFANTALVGAALIRLRGGDPTVRDGIDVALKNFGPILGYALMAATVGVILKSINDRSKGFGRFITTLIGTAWNVATYLVVPILAVEGIGPVDAVKRSVELLKRTWGEQIVGNMGLGAITGLSFFAVILLGGGAIFGAVYFELGVAVIIALSVLLVIALGLLGLISSALNGIYSAAVYEYANTGNVGGFFEDELVRNAFRPKQMR